MCHPPPPPRQNRVKIPNLLILKSTEKVATSDVVVITVIMDCFCVHVFIHLFIFYSIFFGTIIGLHSQEHFVQQLQPVNPFDPLTHVLRNICIF